MKRSARIPALFVIALSQLAIADEVPFSKISLSDGESVIARVLSFENGKIRLRDGEGSESESPIDRVGSISFDQNDSGIIEKRLLKKAESMRLVAAERLKRIAENKEGSPELHTAIVVMYVDTEVPNDKVEKGRVGYRCYSSDGGYTGASSFNLRQAWAKIEFFSPRRDGARRIELKPGPPYKTKNIPIELKNDAIINLGRVVLEKEESDESDPPQAVQKGSMARITFGNGRVMKADVLSYADDAITIRNAAGKEFSGPMDRVRSIWFGDTPPSIDRQIMAEAERIRGEENRDAGRYSTGVVACYFDTEESGEELEQGQTRGRFYLGNGFNSFSVSLREPWAIAKPVIPGKSYRIEIDPGPPYKNLTIPVDLREDGITNLGRIVLEKAEVTGSVSIRGVVKNAQGEPVAGAVVAAGERQTKTNSSGEYKLNGFGLERVKLEASLPGYFGGRGFVSIRDTNNRLLTKDLLLMKPTLVKFNYVMSAADKNSFREGDTEEGTFQSVRFNPATRVSGNRFISESFSDFASDTGLQLKISEGKVYFETYRQNVAYKKIDSGTSLESITRFANIREPVCPPLEPGDVLLIQGSKRERNSRPTKHCVKIRLDACTRADMGNISGSKWATEISSQLRGHIYDLAREGDLRQANQYVKYILELSDGKPTGWSLLPLLVFGGELDAFRQFRRELLDSSRLSEEWYTTYSTVLQCSIAPYLPRNRKDALNAVQLVRQIEDPSGTAAPLIGLAEALAEYRTGDVDRARQIAEDLPDQYGASRFVPYTETRDLLLLILDIRQARGVSYEDRLKAIGKAFVKPRVEASKGQEIDFFNLPGTLAEMQAFQLLFKEAKQLIQKGR